MPVAMSESKVKYKEFLLSTGGRANFFPQFNKRIHPLRKLTTIGSRPEQRKDGGEEQLQQGQRSIIFVISRVVCVGCERRVIIGDDSFWRPITQKRKDLRVILTVRECVRVDPEWQPSQRTEIVFHNQVVSSQEIFPETIAWIEQELGMGKI